MISQDEAVIIAISSLGEFLIYNYEKGTLVKSIKIDEGEFSPNSGL
jgi:hypothetical protein